MHIILKHFLFLGLTIGYVHLFLKLGIDLVITCGWDKKIKFWDARSATSVGCLDNLSDEVESMSLSGSQLMIAVGTSVHKHDLRNLQSVQAKQSFMDIRIKCIRPILDSAGMTRVVHCNHHISIAR